MVTVAEARTLRDRVRRNPGFFFRELLGASVYDKQMEIAEAVRDNPQTTVFGCNAGDLAAYELALPCGMTPPGGHGV